MRMFMYFVIVVVLVHGIAAVVELRQLSVMIVIACALMYLLAAFAFLLPALPIDGRSRIASIVGIHLIAAVYWTVLSPAFDERQIDEIAHSVAGFVAPGDTLSASVKIPYVLVDSERQRALYPVQSLMLLDVAWLVWLLRTKITPTASARAE